MLALCLALALLAKRLHLPFAVALVLGGMTVAFVPGLRRIEFEPELALALFLPPLLQLSAYRTDWPAFRTNLRPILLLALGAVLFTAIAVALIAKLLIPDLPWGAVIALGAIVAPPDAVAATAVLRSLRPPKWITTVLEGESLLNDAAALVLYRFAVGATLAGSFDLGQSALTFVLSALGGGMTGYVVGRLAMLIFARLDETVHDIALSVLASYAAYFAAEAVHASGVLGVVACGFVLRGQHHVFTAQTRLASESVWAFLEFVLTSLVFMLIGMQLRGIVGRLGHYHPWHLTILAASVSLTLILGRFLWIMPVTWIPRLLSPALKARDPAPPANHLIAISWAGMRGVVSLAAALALPVRFPGRDIIIFLAFCAILATLVLQGTTLGPLTRLLGVTEPDTDGVDQSRMAMRRHVSEAALASMQDHLDDPERGEIAKDLIAEYQDRTDQAAQLEDGSPTEAERRTRELQLRLSAVEASRARIAGSQNDFDEDAALGLTTELDLEEEQIRRELGER
ncbi:Na+/H+ antiporter [Sphingomonas abietis]|uniref:Na+/H+ antiporter n=1 Tax=Sphingomonas abietis TaxID=3012344 RepID=A0ABY7NS38_9SPHN|nr:Na+/H+ antiporter [Sphingomonas abietis]WBO24371.1 Na+/H+ antiporter [Sphingomonas abietis]